jgi:hypothetical protein
MPNNANEMTKLFVLQPSFYLGRTGPLQTEVYA